MQANTNENDYYDARILGEILPYSQRLMPDSGALATRFDIFMIVNNKMAGRRADLKTESTLPHRGNLLHRNTSQRKQKHTNQ
jgi:hypothetical protein